QAADDDVHSLLTREVDEQTAEVGRRHAGLAAEHGTDQLHPLIDLEQPGLRLSATVRDGHNDAIDEAERAADDVLVAACDRVERAGVNSDSLGHSGAVMKVIAVSP